MNVGCLNFNSHVDSSLASLVSIVNSAIWIVIVPERIQCHSQDSLWMTDPTSWSLKTSSWLQVEVIQVCSSLLGEPPSGQTFPTLCGGDHPQRANATLILAAIKLTGFVANTNLPEGIRLPNVTNTTTPKLRSSWIHDSSSYCSTVPSITNPVTGHHTPTLIILPVRPSNR